MALSPTLWRTGRVLAGATRLELLRGILGRPGQTVTGLADSLEISLPRASQELRRLQSRGLVRATRQGLTVRYLPVPDPLVASAKPILAAMEAALAGTAPGETDQIIRIAKAFSHARRLAIIEELQRGPRSAQELCRLLRMSGMAAYRHLHLMEEAGLARREGRRWVFDPGSHPLAGCLANWPGGRKTAGK